MPHGAARRLAAALASFTALVAVPAFAQGQGPPGPYVIDVRGATSSLSAKPGFYPPIPASTLIPSRAFGVEAGLHVYFARLGPSRLGVGASALRVRGSAPGVVVESSDDGTDAAPTTGPAVRALLTAVDPQVSFNFGTGAGWSYLSGGIGVGEIVTTATQTGVPDAKKSTGWRRTFNLGAGARWFIRSRLAVGFDVRIHRIFGGPVTPHDSPVSVSAGISVR